MQEVAAHQGYFKTILKNCFVEPLRSKERAMLYLSGFLAATGFASFELFMAFDVAGLGMMPLMIFFGLRYLLGGVLFMPIGFWLVARFGSKPFFKFMVPLQILVAICSVVFADTLPYWALAIVFVFACAPFWLAFHASMTLHTSDHNRGNEVALSEAGFTVGIVLGSMLGGAALAFDMGMGIAATSLVMITMGTLIVVSRLNKAVKEEKPEAASLKTMLGTISARPRLSLMTVMEAGVHTLAVVLAPVWMKILGIGGMIVGLVNGGLVVLKIVLTPFVGDLVNKGDARDISIGSMLYFTGWIPLTVFASPFVLAGSFLFWTAGAQVCAASLMTDWYSDRCLMRLAAREILLALGRMCVTFVCVPMLYAAFSSFAWAALLLSAVMAVTGLLVYRQRLALRRAA